MRSGALFAKNALEHADRAFADTVETLTNALDLADAAAGRFETIEYITRRLHQHGGHVGPIAQIVPGAADLDRHDDALAEPHIDPVIHHARPQIDSTGAGHRHAAQSDLQIIVAHQPIGECACCRQGSETAVVLAANEALGCVLDERQRTDLADLAVGEKVERVCNIERANDVPLDLGRARGERRGFIPLIWPLARLSAARPESVLINSRWLLPRAVTAMSRLPVPVSRLSPISACANGSICTWASAMLSQRLAPHRCRPPSRFRGHCLDRAPPGLIGGEPVVLDTDRDRARLDLEFAVGDIADIEVDINIGEFER